MSYTAKNIKIKEYSEDIWSQAISLAEEYGKPVAFIERGLEACQLARVGNDYFIDRYLKEDKSVAINREVNEISRELLRKLRP
jgi:hypothetical protein